MNWHKGIIPLALLALTACTPRELAEWSKWYEQDPDAAVAFANQPEIQMRLHGCQSSDSPQFQCNQVDQGLTNNHAARWEEIAWCESGRQWDLVATNRTGTYGGGLMIRNNVWAAYGGREFAPTADRASKAQQIEVAERILADVGWGAWDCA